MDKKIIAESKNLNNYNLNCTIDNFQFIIHNFMADIFEDVDRYENHRHSSYELHYIKKGSGTVGFNDTDYNLVPGDLFLIAPFTTHHQLLDEKKMIEYSLRFDVKQLCTHSNNPTIEEETRQIMSLLLSSCDKIIHNQFSIETLFEKAFIEAYQKKPGYYLKVKQAIAEIIIDTARLSFKESTQLKSYEFPSRSIEGRQIESITEFIKDNLAGHITNELLATHVHISERQLHRLIKKHIGISPHQFVTQLRISHVKNLIDKNLYSLKTISEMTGFSSEFHLSSAFKKYETITPRDYIQQSSDHYIESNDKA